MILTFLQSRHGTVAIAVDHIGRVSCRFFQHRRFPELGDRFSFDIREWHTKRRGDFLPPVKLKFERLHVGHHHNWCDLTDPVGEIGRNTCSAACVCRIIGQGEDQFGRSIYQILGLDIAIAIANVDHALWINIAPGNVITLWIGRRAPVKYGDRLDALIEIRNMVLKRGEVPLARLYSAAMSLQYASTGIWEDATVIARARGIGAAFAERVLATARDIALVPAPTGDETARADRVAHLFRSGGIQDVAIDQISDVVARIPGSVPSDKALLLAAHIDTVFAAGTDLTQRSDAMRSYGPGLGDNSLGVASLIHLRQMLAELDQPIGCDLLLTGNVGEEGLGNLRGVNRVLDDHPEIGAMLAVEGQNLGRITHVAVGSKRLRVTVTGPGGHSWGDFGNPSAIHAAARLIDALDRIPLTQTPKTSLNVGTISGGISINSIAPNVTFDIDLRSTDPNALRRVVDRALAALFPRDDRIAVTVDVLGDRPAGQAAINSRIVTSAAEILRQLDYPAAANAELDRRQRRHSAGTTRNLYRTDDRRERPPVGGIRR